MKGARHIAHELVWYQHFLDILKKLALATWRWKDHSGEYYAILRKLAVMHIITIIFYSPFNIIESFIAG